MKIKVYSCIPNGDYNNEDISLSNALERASYELNEGCQDWILISKKELTDEQYDKVLEVMK